MKGTITPIHLQFFCFIIYIAFHTKILKMSTFFRLTNFYKHWPISIKFGTQYAEGICNTTIIDMSTLPTYCCYTTLGKLICNFVIILANLLHQNAIKLTSKLKDKIWLMKYFYCCILSWCCAEAEMLSSTSAIAVTLTSYSKTVCKHTGCTRQLSYCSVKLLSSLFTSPMVWVLTFS